MEAIVEIESYIKTNFEYCPVTGVINRFDRRNSNGSYDKDGYLIIKIKQRQFKSHRLAWFLYYGRFPDKEIDHINRERADNRLINLREVDRIGNIKNTHREPNKITGVVGIYYDKTPGLKKNYAYGKSGKTYRFYTLEEAVESKQKNEL